MSGTVIEAPVARVIFFEDRAQVIRQARIPLPGGASQVLLAGISPVAVDSSLLARAQGARVDEARINRRWRIGPGEQPEKTAALTESLRKLRAERARKDGKRQVQESRLWRLEKAAELRTESIGLEMTVAPDFADSWRSELSSFEASASEAEQAMAALISEVRDLDRRIAVVEARLRESGPFEPILEAAITVDLTAAEAGEVELTIQYIVPCALWRPMHRARLEGSRVEFQRGAAAWEATGEVWRDVEAAFSTARPARRSEPPLLTDDLLAVRKRMEKQIQVAMREQEISTTGEGQDRLMDEIPGVDDGGESRLMTSSMRVTFLPDGRMTWIPLDSFSAQAELDRIARPERIGAVLRRSRQRNGASTPILAGPVELIREGGSAGMTEVPFVAAGETFVLAWGPDESLRIQRETEEHREVVRLTGRQNVTRTVRLFASNLESREVSFQLEERIPVSEIEDVSVEILGKESTPGLKADEQGIVHHTVSLRPLATAKIQLVYRLSAGSSVKGI
ncbi:MAG: hypothetical protein DIJKHBIC_02061 [Thermoanaerobaculia bacterium]|nr:hypothetical protein [Thermoanaerobaculia bacterium]